MGKITKWSKAKTKSGGGVALVTQSCPTHDFMDCSPPVPLSMGFSMQEYYSGLPFASPGIEPRSPEL